MLSAGFGLLADMVAAHADGGDALAGGAEFAVDHVGRFGPLDGGIGLGSLRGGGKSCAYGGGSCGFEKVSSFHALLL